MTVPVLAPPRPCVDRATCRWVEVAAGGRVTGARSLPGATADVFVLTLAAGAARRLVLRRYTDRAWLARRPDLAAYEAEVLARLAELPVAAPRLVAVDPDGTETGRPSVLMTFLPGAPRLVDPAATVRGLAVTLAAIHSVTPPPQLAPFRPFYDVTGLRPPPWSRHADAWETAFAVVAGTPPDGPATLLHRDFHAGNVLWRGERVVGVVDWVNACRGPRDADLGHCRRNLAQAYGPEAAAALLDRYGVSEVPAYWDLVSAVDLLHDSAAPDPLLDEFVAAAVGRL